MIEALDRIEKKLDRLIALSAKKDRRPSALRVEVRSHVERALVGLGQPSDVSVAELMGNMPRVAGVGVHGVLMLVGRAMNDLGFVRYRGAGRVRPWRYRVGPAHSPAPALRR